MTKELFHNIVLAFVAGFVTTFGALLETTPKPVTTSSLIALALAAAYAGVRGVVGLLKLKYGTPALVDE